MEFPLGKGDRLEVSEDQGLALYAVSHNGPRFHKKSPEIRKAESQGFWCSVRRQTLNLQTTSGPATRRAKVKPEVAVVDSAHITWVDLYSG